MATKNTAPQKSALDRMREAMGKKVEAAAAAKGGNGIDFAPDFGSYRIRILPPVGEDFAEDPMSISESELFYNTAKFHFIPKGGLDEIASGKFNPEGKFLWVPKMLTDKKGNQRKDPINEAVAQWYSVGRTENDQGLKNLGSALKLKRHFFTNILLYAEDGTCEYRTLVDRTNEGKLMKVICAAMGLPFLRDVEDNWVQEGEFYDPDQEYFDLIDIVEGYDFKIVKEKTGPHNWDISYEKSFVMKKAKRALSDDELLLLEKRRDLKTVVDFEHSYEVVEGMLQNLMGEEAGETEEEAPVRKAEVKKPAVTAKQPKVVVQDDDMPGVDSLLDGLDDD